MKGWGGGGCLPFLVSPNVALISAAFPYEVFLRQPAVRRNPAGAS